MIGKDLKNILDTKLNLINDFSNTIRIDSCINLSTEGFLYEIKGDKLSIVDLDSLSKGKTIELEYKSFSHRITNHAYDNASNRIIIHLKNRSLWVTNSNHNLKSNATDF